MELIRRDQGYYERSGGGVTVSGGDPLVQSDFVEALFRACKAEGYHTCCESTFCANWSEVEKVLPYTDLIISDLKLMDSALHRQYTGVGNELILQKPPPPGTGGAGAHPPHPGHPGGQRWAAEHRGQRGFHPQTAGRAGANPAAFLSFMRLGEENTNHWGSRTRWKPCACSAGRSNGG